MILEEQRCSFEGLGKCEGQIVLTWKKHIPVCLKHYKEAWQASNR